METDLKIEEALAFSWPSIFADQHVYRANPTLVTQLLADPGSLPDLAAVLAEAAKAIQVSIFPGKGRRIDPLSILQEPITDASNGPLLRTLQTVFYCGLALEWERQLSPEIGAVTFSSGGVFAALLFSGSLSITEGAPLIYSVISSYYTRSRELSAGTEFFQAILSARQDIDLCQWLNEYRGCPVYLKDVWAKNRVLVVTDRQSFQILKRDLCAEVELKCSSLKRADLGHTPLLASESESWLMPLLTGAKFARPRHTLVHAAGTLRSRRSLKVSDGDVANDASQLIASCLVGPLLTRDSLVQATANAAGLAIIGSPKMLEIVKVLGHELRPMAYMITAPTTRRPSSVEQARNTWAGLSGYVRALLLQRREDLLEFLATQCREVVDPAAGDHDIMERSSVGFFESRSESPGSSMLRDLDDGGVDAFIYCGPGVLFMILEDLVVACRAGGALAGFEHEGAPTVPIDYWDDGLAVTVVSRHDFARDIGREIDATHGLKIVDVRPCAKRKRVGGMYTPIVLTTDTAEEYFLKRLDCRYLSREQVVQYLELASRVCPKLAPQIPGVKGERVSTWDSHPYGVMPHLGGVDLKWEDLTTDIADRAISALSDLWTANLSAYLFRPQRDILRETLYKIKASSSAIRHACPGIGRHLDRFEGAFSWEGYDALPKCLLHGDFHVGNLRVGTGGNSEVVAILDPKPMFASRLFDIVVFATSDGVTFRYSRTRVGEVLSLVQKRLEERRLNADEIRYLSVLLRFPLLYQAMKATRFRARDDLSAIEVDLDSLERDFPYDTVDSMQVFLDTFPRE